jgi:hypothetical protein
MPQATGDWARISRSKNFFDSMAALFYSPPAGCDFIKALKAGWTDQQSQAKDKQHDYS